jgi:hypothetical protein
MSLLRRSSTAATLVVAAALSGGGCSETASQLAVPPALAAAKTLEGARCSLASSRPLVIEWPSDERGALEVRLRRGVTAVRYTGCDLTVVDRCSLPRSRYTYSGITPKRESHTFATADDLYARMPVGASKLEASLKSAGHLDLEMTIVGRLESSAASIRTSDLEGDDCTNATHFVRAASVGAFRLDTGAQATVGGAVDTPKLAIGGSGSAKRGALTADGDEQACGGASEADATPPHKCGALLRLELVPIDGHVHAASVVRKERVCPPGERWDGDACVGEAGGTDAPSATARLIVQGAAVFDTTTGLSWQRAPSPRRMGWEAAKRYCRSLQVDGVSGWRLPKKSELTTLVTASRGSPRIDGDMFPSTPAAPFWSFSDDHSSPGDVWAIDFASGKPKSSGSGEELDVRCVR